MAKQLEEMGADSICIKDMAGLLRPYVTYDLVKMMKEEVKIPIQLHTHYTSGEASMVYLKAIEAGVDVIDCAMSPLAMVHHNRYRAYGCGSSRYRVSIQVTIWISLSKSATTSSR